MMTFRVFWLFEDFPGFPVVAAMALRETSHFFSRALVANTAAMKTLKFH